MYKLCPDSPLYGKAQSVIRTTDGACIPLDPDNTDAQAFAKWLKDGGTPESAEEGGSVSAEWVAETIARLLP
ncbi:hypothetical protein UFOVP248_12 [uncultured Caudovirales phage]|uniref:Uncharacterized protein n=1 Tax=uncultured Caudovirales phage TaxID=2100421 RepID=A0A6J5LKX7_9CAUD|nr:hypothetical protein UFOVP248_12 [uncultured Caudovirales phage]